MYKNRRNEVESKNRVVVRENDGELYELSLFLKKEGTMKNNMMKITYLNYMTKKFTR